MRQVKTNSYNGSLKSLDQAVIASFGSKLKGGIILPGDEGYDKTRKVWNGMVDKRPGMIVRCRDTADVIAAVNFAGDNNIKLSVRGGGHNVAGLAVSDEGMVIDLSAMRSVHADPVRRTARGEAFADHFNRCVVSGRRTGPGRAGGDPVCPPGRAVSFCHRITGTTPPVRKGTSHGHGRRSINQNISRREGPI